MTVGTTGDLALAFSLRQRNSELKTQIQQYNMELSTGISADLVQHLGGSFSRLTAVERDMRVLDGFSISIAEAQQYSEVVQLRLGQVVDLSQSFAGDLITANAAGGAAASIALADEARQHFDTVIATLNSQAAGRSLFAGDATDSPAMADADLILAEINTVIAAAVTPQDTIAAIDAWFADPLGFEAFSYTGSNTALAPFKMSDTVDIGVDVRANDPAIRDVLRSLAYAAVSDTASAGFDADDRAELLGAASTGLLTGQERVIGLQSRLGLAQEQIAGWAVRNGAEMLGAEYAKGALLEVDPYETATRLEAAQFQMESLYTVTVRLSQLSLVNFLR